MLTKILIISKMRNSIFRKNGPKFGFVLQSLSTMGTPAVWEKSSLAGWSPEQVSLVPLWRELYVQLSFPPLFWHISHYYFFCEIIGQISELRQHTAYFRGEENNCASAGRLTCIIWIKTDLFLWVLQFTSGCRSCGNWETAVRLTTGMHIDLSVLTYFQNPNGRKKYVWFR